MKNIRVYFIACILILIVGASLYSCKKQKEDTNIKKTIDFNEYFNLINKYDIVTKMKEINYFGIDRTKMGISYDDGTNAFFYINDYENIKIIDMENHEERDKDKIITDVKGLIDFYKEMNLISISKDAPGNFIDIWFNLDAVNKESLPKYEHPRKDLGKNINLHRGELIYSLDGNFENTQRYKDLRHVKIGDRWYLMYD
jgi:predicted RND superfamily exporter protein